MDGKPNINIEPLLLQLSTVGLFVPNNALDATLLNFIVRANVRKRQKMDHEEQVEAGMDHMDVSLSRNKSLNRSLSHVRGPGRDKSGVRKTDVCKIFDVSK